MPLKGYVIGHQIFSILFEYVYHEINTFLFFPVVGILSFNAIDAAPWGKGYENDDDVQCYVYVVSVRNDGSKRQSPDEVRHILERSDKAAQHPEWQRSSDPECADARLL